MPERFIPPGSRLLPVLGALALAACGEVFVDPNASSGASGSQGSATSSGGGGGGQGGAVMTSTSAGQGGSPKASTSAGQGGASTSSGGCSDLDLDNDGWSGCTGDCCDAPGPICGDPAQVNPGAMEIPGNGIDDDCDPSTSDVAPPPPCGGGESLSTVTALDVAKAMDLCNFTTASPPLPEKSWGLITAEQLLADGSVPTSFELADLQSFQTAVLTHFGTGGIAPTHGSTMAGLSTGRMRDEAAPGYQDPKGGTGFNANTSPPPAYLAAHGGVLPASGGCSGACPSGMGANDPVAVRLTIRVPTNAKSLSYDFKFLTAEYGTGVCSPFNDFFLALLDSTAAGIPADRQIALDSLGNPVSVNNVFFDACVPKGCSWCPAGPAELGGTGLQSGAAGGATAWLNTNAPVVPGETIVLDLMIFDVSDNNVDSMVLLDNLRFTSLTPIIGDP